MWHLILASEVVRQKQPRYTQILLDCTKHVSISLEPGLQISSASLIKTILRQVNTASIKVLRSITPISFLYLSMHPDAENRTTRKRMQEDFMQCSFE